MITRLERPDAPLTKGTPFPRASDSMLNAFAGNTLTGMFPAVIISRPGDLCRQNTPPAPLSRSYGLAVSPYREYNIDGCLRKTVCYTHPNDPLTAASASDMKGDRNK